MRLHSWGKALFLTVVVTVSDLAAATENLGQQLSRSHFEFSLELYKTVNTMSEGGTENLVFSPFSVNSVLSMLFLGTGSASTSSAQLRSVLHYDNMSYVNVHKAFKAAFHVFDDKYYQKKVSPEE